MNIFGPTPYRKLNEFGAFVFLASAAFLIASFFTYQPADPSWNTATESLLATNRMGRAGAIAADLLLQIFGAGAGLVPLFLLALAWKWVRSRPVSDPLMRLAGVLALVCAVCAATAFLSRLPFFPDLLLPGGVLGLLLRDLLYAWFNFWGALLVIGLLFIGGIYLTTSFSIAVAAERVEALRSRLPSWDLSGWLPKRRHKRRADRPQVQAPPAPAEDASATPSAEASSAAGEAYAPVHAGEAPPVEPPFEATGWEEELPPPPDDIPIRTLQDELTAPEPLRREEPLHPASAPLGVPEPGPRRRVPYQLPPLDLLNEADPRPAYDPQELKETAARIKSKFEEFNVFGSVVQINPGPVVTTFEFKPEAGVKYSRITTLTEDLCLGLQAESILIERIPGKPTVGIEVPNRQSEIISLRQILESEEFTRSESKLTLAMGKDINGRIKVARLDNMPHLLIAGSTGSGKSVMLNSLIMSILYKSTPEQVRMILVDPKQLEFGLYEGIPHLLTPVVTDARKATNVLKNAVLEMVRRQKLLAACGVRNLEQFNRKVRQMRSEPRPLFAGEEPEPEELRPLPYVLIVIDELSELMMVERAGVEESITRLAQMARAAGMHLVVATQRPSVDVITGLIKANFPARISFRVATRVDSRTVLDIMGAEHLLGKGDMLFLPPGTSRLVRVHGPFVTESEIERVVDFWKNQAEPEYENEFLEAPPSKEDEGDEESEDGERDPLYRQAVRIVVEMGKASTSILQRRLRIGYGRAARLLDRMQKEGIIGPPDGSRPRDILRRPEWLDEDEDEGVD